MNINHVMTAKSQILKQKDNLNEPASSTYKKLCAEEVHPAHIPVLLPRNASQVSNTVSKERERKLLSSDDIVGLYLLDQEIGSVIQDFTLLPYFLCILYSKDMVATFFYDTTFNLGDFYLSPLTYKHPHMTGHPVIPFAYAIHHSKQLQVHTHFFIKIQQVYSELKNAKIITDREPSIITAIENSLPNCYHFYCWNHIKQDVKNWIKNKKNSEKTDCNIYVAHNK